MKNSDYDDLVRKLTEQLRGQLDPARAAFQSPMLGAPNAAETIGHLIDIKVLRALEGITLSGLRASEEFRKAEEVG